MSLERRKDRKNRVLKEGEYQRPNGTYEFKWRDKRGNRHSVSASSLEKLRDKELEVQRDRLDGVRVGKDNTTINDMYDRWTQLKRGLKGNTQYGYNYLYQRFVAPSFGETRLVELKRSDVKAFYNKISDESMVKVGTLGCIQSVLRQVLQVAVEDDYLRYNPANGALTELRKARRAEQSKRRALTRPEQELFERFIRMPGKFHRWYPIFTTMLWTGMRVGEVTGLRWCDIDWKAGTISVNHTLQNYYITEHESYGLRVHTPKTKAGNRKIWMSPEVRKALREEQSRQKELGIKSVTVVDGYHDFIFIDMHGEVIKSTNLEHPLRRITEECNKQEAACGRTEVKLPHISNHTLRHTFATRMCEQGVNIKAMQAVLGHTDIKTTMDVYAEATRELQDNELEKFVASFNKDKTGRLND